MLFFFNMNTTFSTSLKYVILVNIFYLSCLFLYKKQNKSENLKAEVEKKKPPSLIFTFTRWMEEQFSLTYC